MKKIFVKNIPPLQMGRFDKPVVGQFYLTLTYGGKYINYINSVVGSKISYRSVGLSLVLGKDFLTKEDITYGGYISTRPGDRKCYIRIPTEDFYLDI